MAKIAYALIAAWVMANVSFPAHAFKIYTAPEAKTEILKPPPSGKKKSSCQDQFAVAFALRWIRGTRTGPPSTIIVDEKWWKALPYTEKVDLVKLVKCGIEGRESIEEKSDKVVGHIDFRSHLTDKLLAQWRLYKLVIKE